MHLGKRLLVAVTKSKPIIVSPKRVIDYYSTNTFFYSIKQNLKIHFMESKGLRTGCSLKHSLESVMLIGIILVVMLLGHGCQKETDIKISSSTFRVQGTYLTDPCGDTIILKGVNKMSVFDGVDPYGTDYFPEIAKTNANSVRIVWQSVYSNGRPSRKGHLDSLISNCIKAKMIPIVEMHDATCNLDALSSVVNYWIQPDILAIVKKYENAMLVNIANEAGNYDVTANQFLSAYQSAITTLRNAGIMAPLIIDAPDCGKNLELIVPVTSTLIQFDPQHNLMFSVHPYWSVTDGATPSFIKSQLDNAANNNVPLVLGELSGFGGWPGDGQDETKSCEQNGAIDYQSLLSESAKHKIGWLIWEWGPGNGFYDRPVVVLCPAMDMTSNGKYQSIIDIMPSSVNAWVKNVVITSPYSIQNTAIKTTYIKNGFRCN
jgi:mannan endo-1,4-beta-mannosidase